ncbi:DICT sensory domain-containing protein [Haloarcula sediminis]|uniref:DICT sensory domain-containing protein n=1 Tax=Haloarcula sediminis TaxID=3111777 RepID=UPI002D7A1FEE|nr:DICT sensory domain-containing protein [Haloarcula sp. CK38]
MGLRQLIEFIQTLEKELALFNIDSSDYIDQQLVEYFDTQNVRICSYRTTSGMPSDIAVLSTEDDVLEIISVDTLRELVDSIQPGSTAVGVTDAEYDVILGHLKETTFTSYDTEQMLYASREIEDRARRVGKGTVHAGFQRCSIMADQRSIYTDLSEQGLDVNAYGVPDVPKPNLGGGQLHTVETDEIAKTWFVIFDGAGDTAQKSALIAEERDTNTFYGFWTYDAKIVDSALDYLERTYVSPNDTRSPSQA